MLEFTEKSLFSQQYLQVDDTHHLQIRKKCLWREQQQRFALTEIDPLYIRQRNIPLISTFCFFMSLVLIFSGYIFGEILLHLPIYYYAGFVSIMALVLIVLACYVYQNGQWHAVFYKRHAQGKVFSIRMQRKQRDRLNQFLDSLTSKINQDIEQKTTTVPKHNSVTAKQEYCLEVVKNLLMHDVILQREYIALKMRIKEGLTVAAEDLTQSTKKESNVIDITELQRG